MENTILALETASGACSVALIRADQSFSRFVVTQKAHTQLLLPMVKDILEAADLSLKEIDAIAVGRGPGSFTGVRIAISAAQGLGFGLNIPVYPISTLEALCAQALSVSPFESAVIVPALDARMHEVYAAAYTLENGAYTMNTIEHLISPNDLLGNINVDINGNPILALGSGFDVYLDEIIEHHADKKLHFLPNRFPDALQIGLIAQKKTHQGIEGINAKEVRPVYIRDKVVYTSTT